VFNKKKFLSLSLRLQHKKAAEQLQLFHKTKNRALFSHYQQLASWLDLPPIDASFPSLSDRHHFHLKKAFASIRESQFLTEQHDCLSKTPYLPVAIYLENLRSAHNVGSILRTVEAFRLGTVYFSPSTPGISHRKVIATAMGTAPLVPYRENVFLQDLPPPLIAVETVSYASSYAAFPFPPSFSLLFGNEAYGLKSETVKQADYVIQIPLLGGKNSLNVSCALAIVAAEVRKQFPDP
jgi:tRNA G18 (ribose-2'-O)-methylase SpoU